MARRPIMLCAATGVDLSESLGRIIKILGEKLVKSDKCMGVSQLLGARAWAALKVFAYVCCMSSTCLKLNVCRACVELSVLLGTIVNSSSLNMAHIHSNDLIAKIP